MQPVDEHFNPFLYGRLNGVLPKIFEVGDDASAIADDAIADGREYFLVRIVYKMKQGFYFGRFLHGVDGLASGDIHPG
jgi:hypothetical protein